MSIQTWLENRLARPTHNEIRRRQFVLDYLPGVFSFLASVVWTAIFFAVDLTLIAYFYLFYSVVNLATIVLPLLWVRLAYLSITVFALAGVIVNLSAHLAIGGFDAGVWNLVWIVIIPLTVYFSGAQREGIIVLSAALLALGAAILLDPRLADPPPVPEWVRLTYNGFVLITSVVMLFFWGAYLFQQLDEARDRADRLLLNILPTSIAAQLKRDPGTIADGYDEVTVLFADIVNFTTLSADADPVEVVAFLNDIFSDFDDLALKHGLEKIKTIGDAYMVAGGLPQPRPDHCEAVVAFAVEMLAACKRRTAWHGEPVHLRVGVNTGPVVAGVIGRHKFIYDLWGDAVNTASRMESNGVQDVIQVTASVKDKLAGKYQFEQRPPIYIKGKGEMVTYLLVA